MLSVKDAIDSDLAEFELSKFDAQLAALGRITEAAIWGVSISEEAISTWPLSLQEWYRARRKTEAECEPATPCGCSHTNTKKVWIGPMVGYVKICGECKEELPND